MDVIRLLELRTALAEILYIFYLANAAKGKVGGDTDLPPFTVVGVL